MSPQLRRGQARAMLGIVAIFLALIGLGLVDVIAMGIASATHWPAAQGVCDTAHRSLQVMSGIVPMLTIGYAYWQAGQVRLDRDSQPARAIGPTILVGAVAVAEVLDTIRRPATTYIDGSQTYRIRRIFGHVHPITTRPFDLDRHDRAVAAEAVETFLADHLIGKDDLRRISALNRAAQARRSRDLEID